MTDENKSPADGPGEAVIDEPTEHALDPAKDPNTEWEAKAAEQIEAGEDGSSDDSEKSGSSDDDEEQAPSEDEGGAEESGS
jgi:hypothetical protein